MNERSDPDQAAQEAARRAEEERRASLGQAYQAGLDRAGEAYTREQTRQAEERKAAHLKGELQEAWQLQRAQAEREERQAIEARVEEAWTCNGFVPVTYLSMPPWLRRRAG